MGYRTYRGYKIETEVYGAWHRAWCTAIESRYASKSMPFSIGMVKLDIDRIVSEKDLVEKHNMSGEWLGTSWTGGLFDK